VIEPENPVKPLIAYALSETPRQGQDSICCAAPIFFHLTRYFFSVQ